MHRLLFGLAWTLLVAGGVLSLGAHTGWLNPARPPDLEAFPGETGPFHTVTVHEVQPELLGDLPPDRFTFRTIADGEGRHGEMFIAYYERGRRWSGRPHDLSICYQTLGWEPCGSTPLVTPAGARIWSREFEREGERIRVVHWFQRPGLLPGTESTGALLRRMESEERMRQDMASVYFEFPAGASPGAPAFAEAADATIGALEGLWATL